MKQLGEFTIADGLKPSIEGITIAKPIENSTLLRGLDRPSYLYISAVDACRIITTLIAGISYIRQSAAKALYV